MIRWHERAREVRAGDMFCLLPGQWIDYWEDPGDPWQFWWLDLRGKGATQFARACGFGSAAPLHHPENPGVIVRQMRKIHGMLRESPPPSSMALMHEIYRFGAVCQGVLGASRQPTGQPGIVERARSLIQAELERGINVNEVVRMLGVARTTLFQKFKAETGETPIQYLTRKRLERATELLQETRYPVGQVARMSGFRNQKYFMRVFRQELNTTPSACAWQWRADKNDGGLGSEYKKYLII